MKKIITVFYAILLLNVNLAAKDKKVHTKQPRQSRQEKMPQFKNFWSNLSDKEKTDLKKLRNNDEGKFRKAIRAKLNEYKKSTKKSGVTSKKLAEKYHNSSDASEKDAIRKQLREQTEKEFYKNLETRKKQLTGIEKRLSKLRQSYAKREKNADLIINTRVKSLLKQKHSSAE
jgi:hypothetical protein